MTVIYWFISCYLFALLIQRGYGALFDRIEGDDNECLSWEEFEKFFLAAGLR